MLFCFIEPSIALSIVAAAVGVEARHKLLDAVVGAWIDELDDANLEARYARYVHGLDEFDLAELATWHTDDAGVAVVANPAIFLEVFRTLGDRRRDAVKVVAELAGRAATADGSVRSDIFVGDVLLQVSREGAESLLPEAMRLYLQDCGGSTN